MADKRVVTELYSDETFWEKPGKHSTQANLGVEDFGIDRGETVECRMSM